MHQSDCSCASILQFFDAALDGATANRQILDHIFGQFFLPVWGRILLPIMHRFGRCFHLLLEDLACFTTLQTFRSSIGRWRHNNHKFATAIFQNTKKSAAELCQILRVVRPDIYIVIISIHV